jgi:MFS family permease
MLASITPLGEQGRNRRWGVTAAWYGVGSLLGGAVVGWLVGGFGSLVPSNTRPSGSVLAAMLVAVLGIAAAIELHWFPVALPSLPRQVDETWLDTYRGWVIGLGFGFQLGLGVVTIITSPAIHAMLAVAFLTGSPSAGLAIGMAFGAARAVPLLATARVTSPQRLARLHGLMEAASSPAHSAAAATFAASAVAVIARSAAG